MVKQHGQEDNCHGSEQIMKVTEIAEYLRIHPTSVYRLVNEGRIPAMRIGGTWRFKLSEVMKGLQKDVR